MRTIIILLRKEFRQIFRNKSILAMVIVMPVIQLIVLPLAADYEVKNINLAVVDNDRSAYSERLVNSIVASGYFRMAAYESSYKEAFKSIETDKADLILEIPAHFESNLIREGKQKTGISINAINGVKANLGGAYLSAIIRDFNPSETVIESAVLNRYNPLLNYRVFMVPGILAILVTMIGGFLSALNIVKEKETGTIEQINVSPIKKHHFILGKLIPFWILGNIVFTIGLIVSWAVYGIVPEGSILLLYGFIAIYLLAVLGLGLLVSTFCDTQQQAMFIMFFFMMIFILMGGLFTPVDSMPEWARMVVRFNPVSYLISVMRMVILKGSEAGQLVNHLLATAGFAVVLNALAVVNYKKIS
ncbi:MAG: ABC transporter permease [Gemmatimonadaceae bacterium]|nr:ABC transporter permease [Chitinophagaceae bacterium]